MKRLNSCLAAALFAFVAFFHKAALATDDVWTTATSTITTASTNITALLLALIGIVASIFGYKVVRGMMRRSPGSA